MKKLIVLMSLVLSFNSFASAEKCAASSFAGDYLNKVTFAEVEYRTDLTLEEIDGYFSISFYNVNFSENSDGSLSYKYKGLTSEGEQLLQLMVSMEGEGAKDDFLDSQKSLENLKFIPVSENGVCKLKTALGETFGVTDSTQSAILFQTTEGETSIVEEILRKNIDFGGEDDPFDF